MKKQTVVLFCVTIFFLLVSLLIYFNLEKLQTITLTREFPFYIPKEQVYLTDNKKVVFIDDSQTINFRINDKKKLEQIIRRYENIYNERFQTVRIIFSDDLQDFTFAWENGTPFSYSVDMFTAPNIDITLNINLDVLEANFWRKSMIEEETEAILLNALERALVNMDPEKENTHSEAEEEEKSTLIDESAVKAYEELYTDNSNTLFMLSYD